MARADSRPAAPAGSLRASRSGYRSAKTLCVSPVALLGRRSIARRGRSKAQSMPQRAALARDTRTRHRLVLAGIAQPHRLVQRTDRELVFRASVRVALPNPPSPHVVAVVALA